MMTELLSTRKELDVKLNHRQKKMVSVLCLGLKPIVRCYEIHAIWQILYAMQW